MKKLLRISLLASIFMAIFTIRSFAADTVADVSYGNLSSDGSMEVTVTFNNNPSENENFVRELTEDEWNLNGKVMKKTITGVDKEPYFKYYYYTVGEDTEVVSIATPFTMKVGDTYTFPNISLIIGGSTNTDVVSFTHNSITAEKEGKSTISMSSAHTGFHVPFYEWNVTVTDSTTPTPTNPTPPSSGNYTASFDTSSNITVPLIIKGLPSGKNYKYIVDTNTSTPYGSSSSSLKDNSDGTYSASGSEHNLIQLNSDIYVHVYDSDNNYSTVADIKIDKPSFNKYNYFSDDTHATYMNSQIVFYLPYSLNSDNLKRSIHYKIGRITDNSILQAIKSENSDAFAKLKDYAKNDSNALSDEVVAATMFHAYSTDEEIIPGTKLVDDAYYYLYAELDTENGKYIPLESITLAKADVYPSQDYKWYMFFYGSSDFNFDGISDSGNNNSSEDEKKEEQKNEANSNLAKAGESHIILAVLVVGTIFAVVIYRKIKSTKIK